MAPSSTDAPADTRSRLPLPPATLGGFVAAFVAITLIALVSLRTLHQNDDTADLVEHTYQVAIEVRNVLGAIKDAETGQRGFLLTGNPEYLDTHRLGQDALPGALDRLRTRVSDNPAQLQRLDTLTRLVRERSAEIDETLQLFRDGRRDDALATVKSNRGKARMDAVRRVIADIQQAEATLLSQRQQAQGDAQRWAQAVAVGGALLLGAFLLVVAYTASRDYRARERENRLRQHLADLGAELQRATGPVAVADAAIGFLARRVRAAVAALYARDGQARPAYTLLGGYALPAAAPARIALGEGLLGQCAAERRLIVVDAVAAEHLPLTSATGRSRPGTLVMCPAVFDDHPEAVLEFGFTGAAPDEALDLLRRAEHVLALALRNARERERTEVLLEETQRQAEELQSQQEELRVSNEELQSQALALQQSQAELEAQQKALGQTNDQLASRTHDLEAQRRDLLDTQRALEAASRYKSEFLANMSHELRTPLNSALILAKLLADNRDGNLSAEQVKFASAILASNNDLLTLINDILDLAKIESGKADFLVEPVPLAGVLTRLRETFEPMARQKGLQLQVSATADAPVDLVNDEVRLMQVLKNLLANAVKFTEAGEVSLTARAAGPGRIAFDVRDTGIGIAPAQQHVIFEAFRQADGGTSRRFGGTGLGLTISRELAQRMGGDIAVRSDGGHGSCFTLELPVDVGDAASDLAPRAGRTALPLAVPATALPTHAPAWPPTGPTGPTADTRPVTDDRHALRRPQRLILVVEDDVPFAEALVSLAHELDFDAVVATTAGEAMRLARDLRPCGVLMDVGLPDASGLSVLERLKRDPTTRHVPVHMVSATDSAQTALALGAIGYVMKPATREALTQALQDIEALLQRSVRRLLLVEDDAALRENLARLLGTEQLDIVGVSTVAEALAQLDTAPFDCMVTDLALPDGTGYDLLEQMAARADLAFPPVIVYTGRALTRDEEHRLRRHSKSIIIKGARSPERLLDEVTLFLHSVEDTLPPEQRQLLVQARRRDAVLDGRTLLLAEDDVRNIFALTSVFEPLGVKLELARNGREALDRMARGDIDMVLMDVMMPEMDGLTAMRHIRERPEWRNVPIIALTAKAMADDRAACLAAGANDYVSKPIDVDRLISLCRVWCPK